MTRQSAREDLQERIAHLADWRADEAVKEYFPPEMQQTLHLIRQHDLVGALIKQAEEKGAFDNLEGAGKPIDIIENAFEPGELRMIYKILKDNGYAPQWIEIGKEIDSLKARLNLEIEHFKRYARIVARENPSPRAIRHYENKKRLTCTHMHELLEQISQKILDYNLNCPVLQLHRANINIDEEMKRIILEIAYPITVSFG